MGWHSFWSKVDDQIRDNPVIAAGIPFTPQNQALMAGGGALLGGAYLGAGALGSLGAGGAAGAGTAAGTAAATGGGMSLGTGLLGLGSIGASLYGANQAGKAADAQAAAAREGNAMQLQMYNQNRLDQMPWMTQGKTSLEQLGAMTGVNGSLLKPFSMADYLASPNYNFARTEGMRGIMNNQGMRSGYNSGNTLKALSRYNQGLASNEYQNAYNNFTNNQTNVFNRLAALSGTGQTTASNLGAAGQNTANQLSQGYQNAGDARAQGYVANSNAVNSGLNNIFGLYAANKNKLFG